VCSRAAMRRGRRRFPRRHRGEGEHAMRDREPHREPLTACRTLVCSARSAGTTAFCEEWARAVGWALPASDLGLSGLFSFPSGR
jgi:hypothetical protein